MRKFIIVIFLMLFSINSFAATRSCAMALEWWLKEQGKFQGASVSTKQTPNDPDQFTITKWVVKDVPQPTDEEIEIIIDNYNSSLLASEQRKDQDVSALKSKLGLTDAEFKLIKES